VVDVRRKWEDFLKFLPENLSAENPATLGRAGGAAFQPQASS
jgi:hypothetical protein